MANYFEETFKSPFEKETRKEAEKVLNEVRRTHSPAYGWEEIYGGVEALPNGRFRAIRIHRKIASC